jgi:hypothetical protein|tara:strand:+ start:389 stop:517 length:129 start_codon:yes stop_codon:yes gene_type:complete
MKYNMKLVTKAGTYEAGTFFEIVIMVLKHRFWHLRKHGKWID